MHQGQILFIIILATFLIFSIQYGFLYRFNLCYLKIVLFF